MKHLQEIVEAAQARGRKRLAVAYGQDSHTIEAVYDAYNEGLVTPILYGDRIVIEQVCQQLGIDSSVFQIIDEKSDVKAAKLAATAVATGDADVLMKGMLPTDKYMRGILNKEAGLFPPKGVLSHVAVIEMPGRDKLLSVSDVAVIPAPDFKQKQVILDYIVRTAKAVGVEKPKVAVIAATEQILPSQPATIEAAMLAKMADRGQIKGCIVDGPLALDVAIDQESVEIKGLVSPVAGDADCLLFPNIESGNVFYKTNSKLVPGVRQAGILVGAKVPCVLSSRADSIDTKLNSIAIAAMSAR